MTTMTNTNRRPHRGALIVRASTVAVGLAASVGLQLAGPDDKTTVHSAAGQPSILCAADANGSFAVL